MIEGADDADANAECAAVFLADQIDACLARRIRVFRPDGGFLGDRFQAWFAVDFARTDEEEIRPVASVFSLPPGRVENRTISAS